MNNAYHLFVSEMVDDPFWVEMNQAPGSSREVGQWPGICTGIVALWIEVLLQRMRYRSRAEKVCNG